jgi:RecB family endonuclease NucS
MPLFEMKPDELAAVPSTTAAGQKVPERSNLQRLRAGIDAIPDDVLILADEFDAFAYARRQIDLLGVDREGRMVVFELKRTQDGGRLEL